MNQVLERPRGVPLPPLLAMLLRPLRQRQTYLNVLYLLASFPLGLVYFLFLTIGLSVGFGTLIVWVGFPILAVTVAGWWWLASFERELTIWWLGVDIAPMSRPRPTDATFRGRLKAHLSNQVTWTSFIYLLVRFPLGILSFTVAFGAIALTARLVTTPLRYLFDFGADGLAPAFAAAATFLFPPLGVVIGFLSLHLLNGLAFASGRFARLMLGLADVGALTARLSETRAVAVRASAQAERAEQSRRELIVNVSHELRTPTASIRGHVESLLIALDEGADPVEGAPRQPGAGATGQGAATGAIPLAPHELRNYLTIVHRETERLGALVDDLLSLARAEADELRLELVPVPVGEVIDEVYQSLAPLARRERQVTLVREVPPELPPVLADRLRLRQVLLNLVRNAITYTPAGGIVSLGVERPPAGETYLTLVVADTGVGIAPQELERVFERFYRTDSSRARASGGFGLGLSIVRDMVTAMGGSVGAESTEGEGSKFRVTLRAVEERRAGGGYSLPAGDGRPAEGPRAVDSGSLREHV